MKTLYCYKNIHEFKIGKPYKIRTMFDPGDYSSDIKYILYESGKIGLVFVNNNGWVKNYFYTKKELRNIKLKKLKSI